MKYLIFLLIPCFCMGQNSENDSLNVNDAIIYGTDITASKMTGLGFKNFHIDPTALLHVALPPQTKTDTIQVPVLCTKMKSDETIDVFAIKGKSREQYVLPYATRLNQERTHEWQTWLEPFHPDINGHSMGMRFWESGYVVTSTRWLDPTEGCYQLLPLQNDTND